MKRTKPVPLTRREFITMVGATGASISLGACTDLASRVGGGGASGPINITMLTKALANPVFEVTRQAAVDTAAKLGDVTVEYVGPTSSDAQEQVRILDDIISRGTDAIAVNAVDPAALAPGIDRAIDAGIPTITWDSDTPDSKRLWAVTIDNVACGRLLGEITVEMAGTSGVYRCLTGEATAQNLMDRMAGFRSVTDQYPDIDVVATDLIPGDDMARATGIVEEGVTGTPDMVAYAFMGMWPYFGALSSMPNLKDYIDNGGICTTIDSLVGVVEGIAEGYCNAAVGYSWFGYGPLAVDSLVTYIREGTAPSGDIFEKLFVMDKGNIDEYLAKVEACGGVDPACNEEDYLP